VVPIESEYVTSNSDQSSTANVVLACTISEIWQL